MVLSSSFPEAIDSLFERFYSDHATREQSTFNVKNKMVIKIIVIIKHPAFAYVGNVHIA